MTFVKDTSAYQSFSYELGVKCNEMYESYIIREFDKCREKVKEYVELLEQNKKNPYIIENSVHPADIYLGLMALEESNIELAKEYLIKAGNPKTAMKVRLYGPNMLLARELAKQGEEKVVVKYLDLCKKIWFFISRARVNRGIVGFPRFPLRKWKSEISRGKIPNFGHHLYIHLRPKYKALTVDKI